MRFLVLVHPYPPTPSSGAHRWGGIVKYLRREGHDVRVVTSGAFGRLDDPDEERGVIRTADLMASARLRRLAGLPPLAEPGAGGGGGADLPPVLTKFVVPDPFLLSWAPMALRAAWRALSERPADCVITSSPNESAHLVGLALRRRLGHAWIADLRDGWTFERFLPEFPTRAQRSLTRARAPGVRRRRRGHGGHRPIADDLRRRHASRWSTCRMPGTPTSRRASARSRPPTDRFGWCTPGRSAAAGAATRVRCCGAPPAGGRAAQAELRLKIAGRVDETDARLIGGRGSATRGAWATAPRRGAPDAARADMLMLVTSRHSGRGHGEGVRVPGGRPADPGAGGMNEAARIVKETGTGAAVDLSDGEAVLAALRAAVEGRLRYEPRGLDTYRQPAPALRIAEIAERALRR